MSALKVPQGQWHAYRDANGRDWWEVAEKPFGYALARVHVVSEHHKTLGCTTEATARLFAVAPKLYEALERLVAANVARSEWPENDSTKQFDAMLYELGAAEEAASVVLSEARGEAR